MWNWDSPVSVVSLQCQGTAIVIYSLLFANQGKHKLPVYVSICSKQSEVYLFHFRLHQKIGSCHFPFYVCGIAKTETCKHGEIET
jgi:hypothetical protein